VATQDVQHDADGNEDPIVARHNPPPGWGVPPDVIPSKPFETERRVKDEPEEIFKNPEQDEERNDARLGAPRKSDQAKAEWEMYPPLT